MSASGAFEAEDFASYMKFAKRIAENSTCKRRHHGAILVPVDGLPLSGYNRSLDYKMCDICPREAAGAPSGTAYESCRAVHAEQDAICLAARQGVVLEGATLVITGCPCHICAKLIVASGIRRVVLGDWEPHNIDGVVAYLEGFGVEVVRLGNPSQ